MKIILGTGRMFSVMYFIISVHILILTFTNKTALGKITFVTRFLPSENKVYIHALKKEIGLPDSQVI